MTESVVVQQVVNQVTVTEENKVAVVSSPGAQGIQGPQGNIGPQGPQGIQGPVGPAGGVATSNFSQVFEQQTNANTWNINHGLGYRPAVFAKDYGGTNIEGDIQHLNANSLTITFNSQEAGYAYLT